MRRLTSVSKCAALVVSVLALVAACSRPTLGPRKTVQPPGATQLAFFDQPSTAIVGQVLSPAVRVEIRDEYGALVATSQDPVTLVIATNPGGGTLSGTTTVNAVGGIATFADLRIDRPGTGYTLTATSPALTGATSTPFTLTLTLAFRMQPTSGNTGQVLSPAVQVAIEDANGTIYGSAQNPVTVAIGANPGGGILSGTKTVNALAGVATFADLSIDRAGIGYTLTARSPALSGATSGPITIAIKITFSSVSAGGEHTCGLSTAQSAYCWGDNSFGQLGDGSTTHQALPVAVRGGQAFISLSAGNSHTCGITVAHTAYCWGDNGYGQLGDGTTTSRTTPVPVLGGLNVAAVSAGDAQTCAVTTAGGAYCWGYNIAGQLGDGTTTDRTSPVAVVGGLTFAAVSASGGHTCGLTTAGAAYCWGDNVVGSLGDGTTTGRTSPVAVVGGLTFANLTASGTLTCGVTTAGAAYCWGGNAYGELGDGTTTNRSSPTAVAGGLTFTAINAGGQHACGVTTGGAGYCWGYNNHGQLGDGTITERATPVAVSGGLSFATMTAAFLWHTCGVTGGGVAYCWGDNGAGQLGDGTATDRDVPVKVIQ